MFGKIKLLNEYKRFENKLITKKHQIQETWIEYKIFKLKYGNAKQSNVRKYQKCKVMTCKLCFYLFVLSVVLHYIKYYITLYYSKKLSKKALDMFDIGKYFPRVSYFATVLLFSYLKASKISCKKWETWKILSILHSAPCNNNYITAKCLWESMWHFCHSFLFTSNEILFSITLGINTLKLFFKLFSFKLDKVKGTLMHIWRCKDIFVFTEGFGL